MLITFQMPDASDEFAEIGGRKTEKLVELTEFEVASYLMYPFVSQQCNLIGQTIQDVVMVNFICKSGSGMGISLGYTPVKDQLKEVQEKYGRHSGLTQLCGNMQVMCSRVRTGQKTKILDICMDCIPTYRQLCYASHMGGMVKGFGARFTEADRKDSKNKKGTVKTFARNVRKILQYRPYKVKVVRSMGEPRLTVLDFPVGRLKCDDIDEELVYDYICASDFDRLLYQYEDAKYSMEIEEVEDEQEPEPKRVCA